MKNCIRINYYKITRLVDLDYLVFCPLVKFRRTHSPPRHNLNSPFFNLNRYFFWFIVHSMYSKRL